MFSAGKYVRDGERAALLTHMAAAPRVPWPLGSSFGFRSSTGRVHGSPQLDDVLLEVPGSGSVAAVVTEMEAAFPSK
jgi:hypothetical protein